jgi:hypothetical protein
MYRGGEGRPVRRPRRNVVDGPLPTFPNVVNGPLTTS